MVLFDGSKNMSSLKEEMRDRVRRNIENLTEKELENSDDSLELIFMSKFKIPEIVLGEIYQEDGGETQIDISKNPAYFEYYERLGTPVYKKAKVLEIHIPFDGNGEFLEIQPSTFVMASIRGRVVGKELIIDFNFFPDNADKDNLKREIDNDIDLVKKNIEWMNKDLKDFNGSLPVIISSCLKLRRENLRKEKEIISGLGIPRKEKVLSEIGFTKPIEKIELKIEEFPKNEGKELDPVLTNQIYDGITGYVNRLGINLERCSSVIRNLDEEPLRDSFFMALNSSYRGLVSSEAFNKNGKTDILIRYHDNNLYISEFKIWRGDEYFLEGIEQLLNNLTWRDSKCSYVIFSRNSDFSKVLDKSKELISKNPNHIKMMSKISENCFRFLFKNKYDSKNTISLTLHLFNIK